MNNKDMPDEVTLYKHYTSVSPHKSEFAVRFYRADGDFSEGVKYVRADLAPAPKAAEDVPESYALLPIEATDEMMTSGLEQYKKDKRQYGEFYSGEVYSAMVKAALRNTTKDTHHDNK